MCSGQMLIGELFGKRLRYMPNVSEGLVRLN